MTTSTVVAREKICEGESRVRLVPCFVNFVEFPNGPTGPVTTVYKPSPSDRSVVSQSPEKYNDFARSFGRI